MFIVREMSVNVHAGIGTFAVVMCYVELMSSCQRKSVILLEILHSLHRSPYMCLLCILVISFEVFV